MPKNIRPGVFSPNMFPMNQLPINFPARSMFAMTVTLAGNLVPARVPVKNQFLTHHKIRGRADANPQIPVVSTFFQNFCLLLRMSRIAPTGNKTTPIYLVKHAAAVTIISSKIRFVDGFSRTYWSAKKNAITSIINNGSVQAQLHVFNTDPESKIDKEDNVAKSHEDEHLSTQNPEININVANDRTPRRRTEEK